MLRLDANVKIFSDDIDGMTRVLERIESADDNSGSVMLIQVDDTKIVKRHRKEGNVASFHHEGLHTKLAQLKFIELRVNAFEPEGDPWNVVWCGVSLVFKGELMISSTEPGNFS